MNKRVKILADSNMPKIETLFSDFADVSLKPGRDITAADLTDKDVLLCRSVTQVNKALLAGSQVRFVGSATIGTDHLDTKWLNQNGIKWCNAPGCNADAVVQYVISAIAVWLKKTQREFSSLTVGVVGYGNVGSRLWKQLKMLDAKVVVCDPLLEKSANQLNIVEKNADTVKFVSMDEIFNCDVVTFHVPLTRGGEHATYHFVQPKYLDKLHANQLLINASRGAIFNENQLLKALQRENFAQLVLDVFENEPNINSQIVDQCLIATPHIAGHTLEGKIRGSFMLYQQLCHFLEVQPSKTESMLYPSLNVLDVSQLSDIKMVILALYDIEHDSRRLKSLLPTITATQFEQLRKNYANSFTHRPRRDYSGWRVEGKRDVLLGKLKFGELN